MAKNDRRSDTHYHPQPDSSLDPAALEAAETGKVPPAQPGNHGESAPGQPSRAEIFSLNPGLANDGKLANPTDPEGPVPGLPYTAGAPVAGKTESLETAPPGERPDWSSSPEAQHADMKPPMAPLSPDDSRSEGQEPLEPEEGGGEMHAPHPQETSRVTRPPRYKRGTREP